MGNIEDRPYAGTWVLNNRSVVKYTPDALVFINGDTSLPGCARCRGRIEVQRFVTGMSVEAGTDPVSHSASIQLALPRVQGKQVFIDGYNILRPGLEVHIFMRGYFPIRGMFSHLSGQPSGPDAQGSPSDANQLDLSKYATYPYYPVFHGLITQVNYEYSDGFYYGSLNCTSLLHFWQYVNITTAGAWRGQSKRPYDDTGRTTLYGHNFNNTHPFAIIYTLYKDVAGSAAGVDFALSEETNVDATADSFGNSDRQIFSMVSLYWEQRFKTRIQNLRMYGVNGQLFNAAQQAWLGTNRDVNGLIESSTANDPTTTLTASDPFSARYSVAKSLGLQQAGADFTFSPLIQQDNEFFNLSVLDMFAFNQSIGEMGANNLWQTTYQTKMDIAQRVMEVTGYEFYQDVDGDLVFKPPFWNLDTAPNRYYRLEDSDIINITFTEKEPNATYIIVRGVWIPGLTDVTPPDDVLLKRGLYIDYKLVAQFGWRPAPTLELTYVIDPKVLFWIGVARLDALNVDTFSASATIPIRAELRPGYPVYIPFADCYYYIRQLSHSFSFGGTCTTSLVLTCRRAKWHAPGFLEPPPPGKSAIEQIRLDRPDLPPRPLEAIVNDVPRWVGFPNVVMALDPRKFNPNFSVVGVGIDYFDQFDECTSADLLFDWIVRDVALLNAFEIDVPSQSPDGNTVIEDPTQVTRLKFRNSQNEWISFTVDDLVRGFADYRSARSPVEETNLEVNKQADLVAEKDRNFNAFKLAQKAGGKTKGNPDSDRASATDRLDVLRGEQQNELVKFRQTVSASPSIDTLVQIFEALQPNSNKPIRRKIDGIPGSDVRLSYFESLGALKGQYLAGSIPGNYRYFSCSHPFESQQGMPVVRWDDGKRSKGSSRSVPRRGSTRSNRGGRRSATTAVQGRLPDIFQTLQAATDQLPNIDRWFDPNQRNGEFRKWSGLTSKRGRAAREQMDPEVAQRLVDITSAANTIVQRVLDFPGYSDLISRGKGLVLANPRLLSGYRPASEPAAAEAYHSAGTAIDITWFDGGRDAAKRNGITDVHNEVIRIVRTVVAQAYSEGLIQGMGFYILNKSEGGTFTHTDRRGQGARRQLQQQRQALREEYEAGRREPPTNERKRRKFFKIIGKRDPQGIVNTKEKSAAPGPARRGKWTENAESWGDFVRNNNLDIPLGWANVSAVEDKVVITNDPATDPPADPPENTTPPEPVPLPPPPEKLPTVEVFEQNLNTARTVVQFLPTTKSSGANRRAPEVILGTGTCRKGLQIARGPNRTPEVVTTDQIQRISFVRHQAGKFMQVVGTSQNSGSTVFKGVAFQKNVTQKFDQAVQNLSDPNVTVDSIFRPIYDQIAEDLASDAAIVPDIDENGDILIDEDANLNIKLVPFEDVLTVENARVPASVQEQLAQGGIGTDTDPYFLGDFTFTQLALIEGYVPKGPRKDDSQNWQQPARNAASNIALEVIRQIERGNNLTGPDNWPGYLTLVKNIQQGDNADKQTKLSRLNTAFNDAMTKAFGANEAEAVTTPNEANEKAVKEGKIESPIHSPVFPVSDEKGYEHYGAYRYGRGLSVEPGGTWEFIHNKNGDPFKNVTAQSAEEFLNVLTLVKTGRIDGDTSFFNVAAAREAALDFFTNIFSQKQDPLSTEGLSPDVAAQGREAQAGATATVGEGDVVRKTGLSELERAQVEQSVQDLAQTITRLGQTARGRDVLRELLEANGDDPNILKGKSFDISDTQFTRNFVNYAVNFGKSPVFKTTVSNAAYRLSDLTSHLLNRAGQTCICRGTDADVTLEAYSRTGFITAPGIDQENEKAEAFASETAIKQETPHALQQKAQRGEITGEQPDASTFQETVAPGQGTPLPSVSEDPGTVSAENPPTTANIEDLGTINLTFDPDTLELIGATAVGTEGPVDVLADEGGTQIEPTNPLDNLTPGQVAALQQETGLTGAQLSAALEAGEIDLSILGEDFDG